MAFWFLFVQFEFTHALGPHAGRYVVVAPNATEPSGPPVELDPVLEARNREVAGVTRAIGATDVLVIGVRGSSVAAPRTLLLRRARVADPDGAAQPVPLALATFVAGTDPLANEASAKARLDELRLSGPEQAAWVKRGLGVLNRAIQAYRIGAPDPYVLEVARRDARTVRIGYGTTDQVQAGEYTAAIEIPPPSGGKLKREERLRPAEAVASVLAGHNTLFEAEDVLLRALLDLDAGRTRAAAQQATAGMRLLRDEVYALEDPAQLDLDTLAAQARRAHELAEVSDTRALSAPEVSELDAVVSGVGDLLAGWRSRRDQQ